MLGHGLIGDVPPFTYQKYTYAYEFKFQTLHVVRLDFLVSQYIIFETITFVVRRRERSIIV